MRIFNSLIVPKSERGLSKLFQHPFRCKTPKNRREDPLKTFKNFEKKVSQSGKKGRGKSHSTEKLEGGTLLGFAFQGRGDVQNQVLSTFGKSESFTKSGTYAMSEKSDEKKRNKTSHCNSQTLFTRKCRLKTSDCNSRALLIIKAPTNNSRANGEL